jgi:N-acetylmuramoyl-L-alanine amidase
MEVMAMFLDFYELREQPFGVTPDPAYLYASHTHCEALDSLTEAILEDRGFLALIAEPGMGKTTLLNQVLEGLRGTARAVFLFQTQCNSREFFQYLMSELGVESTGMGLVAMHNKLNEILFAEMLAGRRFVLIVDEAQNLDESVLETIRLLSNFETPHAKLLQIILAGQPQLGEKLGQKELAQLLQRITVIKHLEALSEEETAGYVRHRLKVAGYRGKELFEPDAMALIAERSQGIPRNINKICFRALLEGYAEGCTAVSSDIVEKATRRLGLETTTQQKLIMMPSPSAAFPSADPPVAPSLPASPQLTYAPSSASGAPGWGLWAGALMALLLSAGLALPRTVVRQITQKMRDEVAATKSLVHRESAANREAVESKAGEQPAPSVTAERASSTEDAALSASPGQVIDGHAQPRDAAKSGPSSDALQQNMANSPTETSANLEGQLSLTRELGLKINRIAIDPGHGGYDTGTMGPRGLLEKNLCLDVALRLGRLIEENIPSAEVIYTRRDDRHVPLEERSAIANDAHADLFISIHANSSGSREIRGVETYYVSLATSRESRDLATRENALAESSLHNLPELVQKIARNEKLAESKQLAADIQNALSQRLQIVSRQEANRGVKQAPFIVLTGANMPAVLSEISFVSNASDESLLLESGQRQRVAEGLYRGVAAYLANMASPARAKQKLVDESHTIASTGFATSTSEIRRLPFDQLKSNTPRR